MLQINETCDVSDSDEVMFIVFVEGENGQIAFTQTPQIEDVDSGEYYYLAGTLPAILNSDPGSEITLKAVGYEIDDISSNEELKGEPIMIERQDLLLNWGRAFRRFMPYLTGDDGEYAVEIEVSVT